MLPPIEDRDRLLTELDRGESLPAHWYTEPAITALEIEKIFRKTWSYIGCTPALARTGDFVTGNVGEVPVVVVRNEKGLAAFVNVCRHRKHEVMSGCGNARTMQCPYHAWTYDLNGCLREAPRSSAERDFKAGDYPLLPVRVETLGTFVFVNLEKNAASLASYFRPVLDLIATSGIDLETLELHQRDEWTAPANWKTMLENYLECYHCAVAHPGFSATIDVTPSQYKLAEHGWCSSQLAPPRAAALEGTSRIKTYDARGSVAQAQYHFLWPNLTININPGFPNLSLDVWAPDGPRLTKGFTDRFFGPGVPQQFAEELIAFSRQVGEEDTALVSSVQRGLSGGLPERCRLLPGSEHLCIHFQKLVVHALAQQ
ncbi:MAG: aromatic ring-hydroxylating dioxygenase subunit alpha [Terriglobales bacterium]|jgi:choline monooxygenase